MYRLSEVTTELARFEEMRLKDNREAAADLQIWEQEKQALTARIHEQVTGDGSNIELGRGRSPSSQEAGRGYLARFS